MGIPLYKYERVDSGECIQCFKCIPACRQCNATVKAVNKNINTAIAAVAAVFIMISVYCLGAFSFKSNVTKQASTDGIITVTENKLYHDGKYEGSAIGFRGAVTTVSVTVEGDIIKDIEVVSHGDDAPYFDRSYDYVANKILSLQSTDVDVVSGATYSSIGIRDAVAAALDKAKLMPGNVASDGQKSEPEATKAPVDNTEEPAKDNNSDITSTKASSIYKDGTYEGSAKGFKDGITNVAVVIKNGKIEDVQIVSHGDDAPFVEKSMPVIDEIIKTQSTDVDVVSGATFSSVGIKDAVAVALDKAKK